ncbi:MAG: DUF4276 family protein [Candidatus Sumerlaeia bacterium]|nr:DUF4276 family protein [Candidatus Sumerlaeia bacterium]
MGQVYLALVEGVLEEPLARRLLNEVGIDAEKTTIVVAGGCGPFWERAPSFNQAAKHIGYVLGLTDLDNHPCPVGLIAQKLNGPRHPQFVLRIQVRELESWLLADAKAWAKYLKVPEAIVSKAPDDLTDPKQELVNLVRRCRKKQILEDIVPEQGTPRVVGPGYTIRISEFIADHWSPRRGAQRSPSLKRALEALERVAAAP